jgi:uncharacterized protein (TIGR02145 family)
MFHIQTHYKKFPCMEIIDIIQIRTVIHAIVLCLFISILLSCENEKMPDKIQAHLYEIDSVKDIDGNIYETVKIGDQWWMAENLNVLHFRNGDNVVFLNQVTPQEWAQLSSEACCYSPGTSYGLLYNGYAVTDTRVLAPEGWHISTDEDWKKLEQFLGMSNTDAENTSWRGTNEGGKLKSTKSTYGESTWIIRDNVRNTNEYGFSALPGGCRIFNGEWGNPGSKFTGFWWTTTAKDENRIWYRYLDYQYSGIFRFYGQKTYGFSIRCVKD